MAAQVLRDGADPATMPIQFATDFIYLVNGYMAEQLGLVVPEQFHAYLWFPE